MQRLARKNADAFEWLQATAGWRPGFLLYQTASHAASLALARWHGWRPELLLYQTASHAASLALARWHGWRQIPSGQIISHAASLALARWHGWRRIK